MSEHSREESFSFEGRRQQVGAFNPENVKRVWRETRVRPRQRRQLIQSLEEDLTATLDDIFELDEQQVRQIDELRNDGTDKIIASAARWALQTNADIEYKVTRERSGSSSRGPSVQIVVDADPGTQRRKVTVECKVRIVVEEV